MIMTQKTAKDSDYIPFSFDETKPDLNSFWSRFYHFLSVTEPMNFFVSDEEVVRKVKIMRHYERMANFHKGQGEFKPIMIT